MDRLRYDWIDDLKNPEPKLPSPSPQGIEAWIMDRIALVLSAYRRDDYDNPELFVMQAKANLLKYPQNIIEYVTSPTTGVQSRNQWPPSIAELVKACEQRTGEIERMKRYSAMEKAAPRVQRPLPPEGQDYFSLVAKYGKPIGPFDEDRQLLYKAVP